MVLTTDWSDFGLPADAVKGGLCMGGIYDMEPAMNPQRYLDRIDAPVVVSCGSLETPEFQRQARDFAVALRAAGKTVQLVTGRDYFHQDMWDTLGNPYGPDGRAALAMMGL